MDIKNIHIAKIVGLSKYESELEARLELEHLHTLTNKQLYTIVEDGNDAIVRFGKYKDMTISDIAIQNQGYLNFIIEGKFDEKLKCRSP